MAKRRMFNLDIVDTDKFMDMPSSAQCLYFHLGLRADDDGFVSSPKKIITMAGCAADDFKLLIAKGYIIPFESGVVVITHWKIHNWIRSDRYNATINTHEKALLCVDKNGEYKFDIPNDNQMSAKMQAQDRLGKDSIGKDSLIKKDSASETDAPPKSEHPKRPNFDYEGFQNYFNTYCLNFASIREMTDTRKKAIKNFLKNHNESELYLLVDTANSSDFLTGNNDRGWKANFDWILKPANAVKILEGNYNNAIYNKKDKFSEWAQEEQAQDDFVFEKGDIYDY